MLRIKIVCRHSRNKHSVYRLMYNKETATFVGKFTPIEPTDISVYLDYTTSKDKTISIAVMSHKVAAYMFKELYLNFKTS